MKIGVIGIGAIGVHLAQHALSAGHDVRVWNRTVEATNGVVAAGAFRCQTPLEAFAADVAISALFDDAAVEDVLLTPAILASAERPSLHICMSTISPELADRLEEANRQAGIRYVSAPFFGRPEAAAAAQLNILAAGDPEAIECAHTILSIFGTVWPLGDHSRHANLAKIAGNFMICSTVAVMAEASAVLRAAGADEGAFMDLMTQTLFAAPIYRTYGPSVVGRAPLPELGIAIPRKDVGLMKKEGNKHGIGAGIAATVLTLFDQADALGLSHLDMSRALASAAGERTAKLARSGISSG